MERSPPAYLPGALLALGARLGSRCTRGDAMGRHATHGDGRQPVGGFSLLQPASALARCKLTARMTAPSLPTPPHLEPFDGRVRRDNVHELCLFRCGCWDPLYCKLDRGTGPPSPARGPGVNGPRGPRRAGRVAERGPLFACQTAPPRPAAARTGQDAWAGGRPSPSYPIPWACLGPAWDLPGALGARCVEFWPGRC